MTTAAPVTSEQPGNTHLAHWSLTTAIATGDWVSVPGAPDRCWQAVSSSWGGATMAIEGSMDGGTTAFSLHDGGNTAIAATANDGGAIMENPLLIRAKLTTAGTAAAVDVYVLSRSNRR